jgi:hypothetical protein
VRANALRLLEKAHVERLTAQGDARESAEKALDRFQVLADQGDAEAAFHLAEAHRTGFGRPRNHWKALEHYRLALDLGHPRAEERLRQVEAREEVADDSHEVFGRQALLKATYARSRGEHHYQGAQDHVRERLREGVGVGSAKAMLILAALLAGYVATDIYTFGMGTWRPDPTRVVWGFLGKIHPPRDASVGRVLPGWLRPDVSSVALRVNDFKHGEAGAIRLSALKGKVVYLRVVDGRHPAVAESVPYLKNLDDRRGGDLVFYLVYIPHLETESDVNCAIQWALDVAPALPLSPKALRPLGPIKVFPMNFIIDRHGRIRQRWAGFSEAITEEALKGALAET